MKLAATLSLQPIGIVHSPYRDKYAAPRQPLPPTNLDNPDNPEAATMTAPEAAVKLFPHHNYEQALSDLAGMERVWLVTWFDQNCDSTGKPIWKPKVLTPRGRTKRGVFATRSPHRPNPLGISVVRLLAVKGLRLEIGNCDVLDGTPVLDIKPYIPLYDSFPESRTGWFDDEAAHRPYTLIFMPLAEQQLQAETAQQSGLVQYLHTLLTRDPYPHPYRRIRTCEPVGTFELAMKLWRVRYHVTEEGQRTVVVELVWQVNGV